MSLHLDGPLRIDFCRTRTDQRRPTPLVQCRPEFGHQSRLHDQQERL